MFSSALEQCACVPKSFSALVGRTLLRAGTNPLCRGARRVQKRKESQWASGVHGPARCGGFSTIGAGKKEGANVVSREDREGGHADVTATTTQPRHLYRTVGPLSPMHRRAQQGLTGLQSWWAAAL